MLKFRFFKKNKDINDKHEKDISELKEKVNELEKIINDYIKKPVEKDKRICIAGVPKEQLEAIVKKENEGKK